MTGVLASALLHSIWQGALIASVAALALRLLRGASAQARYVVAGLGLAAMLGAFAITAARSINVEGGFQTALIQGGPQTALKPPPLLGPGPLDFSSAVRELQPSDLTSAPTRSSWPARLQRWSTAAVPLWLAGVVLLSIRVSVGWIGLERLRRKGLSPAASDVRARVSALAHRLRVSRPVRVAQSAAVQVPSVVGWLRPLILLPASALSGLSPAQLDAVLAHELAHIRRHDFAVNALQTVADVLLFYHPACWWLSRRIRVEREHCCDDIAVAVCGDRLAYAAALADLETLRQQPPAFALAATDGPLLRRVRRIVASPDPVARPAWPALVLPLALVAIVIGGVAVTRAQQAPEQVRVPGMSRTIPGGRGVIAGQVVEAGTGRPIAGAKVDVRGSSGQVYVTTDQSGRYETPALEPGAYSITATAPDHAPAFYEGRAASLSGQSTLVSDSVSIAGPAGAQRITLAGNVEMRRAITIDVQPGSRLTDIDLSMQATGQVSGRILDDRGRGLADAYVQLVATQANVLGVVLPVAYTRSESDGSYRVAAAPGDYMVFAYMDRAVRPSRDASLTYLATFFPGVRTQNEAQVIRLDGGVEQYGVDFALLSSRTVRVSGTVVDPAGIDLEDVSVSLRPGPGPFASTKSSVQLHLNARGEFDARDVVPGSYIVDVTDPRRPARWKTPREPLDIGEDVSGVEIRAVAAASITGRVVKDPRSTGRLNLTQTVVSFVDRIGSAGSSMSNFNVDQDGSFHNDVPTGALTMMVMGPQGWATRAMRLDGVDVFGYPLEITPGAHELEVVVTDHFGSASGLVVDRRGAPLGGFDVVLFPSDEARWYFASPLIRQTRSSENGRFELPLLPPGDYLAVATERVPFLMIGDPQPTLRRLQSIATRLKVGDGEQKTISIRASPVP